MKRLPSILSVSLLFATTHILSASDLKLAALFDSHMVLQREAPVPIWGQASPGELITVEFLGQKKTVTAGDNGKWSIRLDPIPATATPQKLLVTGNPNDRLELEDVLVGDVWVCSGQSNMERQLGPRPPQQNLLNWEQEVAEANYPALRHFGVAHKATEPPQEDVQGKWEVCSPEAAKEFTAVGYFFGRELHRELNIPIGLLHSSWGGTTVAQWTSLEALNSDTEIKAAAELKLADPNIKGSKRPSALFLNMIRPLIPCAIKGAIWYQGESGAGIPTNYAKLFQLMITDWRKQWGIGEFPFYFVQLPNLGKSPTQPVEGGGWPQIREEQASALALPNTGMAVTIDVGLPNDVHPINKAPVGQRLAKLALAQTYKKDGESSGPLFANSSIESNAIRVSFTHTTGGLKAREGETLKGFAIAGKDKRFVWADVKIDGDTLLISSPEVSEPESVRYAWNGNPESANLINGAGLPAAPFRTDHW